MNSSDIELVYIIKGFVKNIDFNLSDYENTMQTLRKVEKTYWQYCCHSPHYQKITFSQYFKHVCCVFNMEWNYQDYIVMKSQYNYYKKSIPTAGAMIHYHENKNIYLLLVKNNRAKVFSLPKGKQEKNETVQETAIREVMEETGIDISEYINATTILYSSGNNSSENSEFEDSFEYHDYEKNNQIGENTKPKRNDWNEDNEASMKEDGEGDGKENGEGDGDGEGDGIGKNDETGDHYNGEKREILNDKKINLNYALGNDLNKYYICKSTIYDIKINEKQEEFKDYDNEEIVDIVWTPLSKIHDNPHLYSRQVKTAAQILSEKYLSF